MAVRTRTTASVELTHRVRKDHFELQANIKDIAAPAVWNAMLVV
jgi:hypothetical protein